MAVKFNRNHPEVQNDKFYLDDYRADLNGLEEDLRTRLQDFERLPCIVSGGSISIPANNSEVVEVSPLVAYDGEGHRIVTHQPLQVSLINLSGGENWIVARPSSRAFLERQAFFSGATYPSRLDDAGQVMCVPPENVASGDVILGVITRINGSNHLSLAERTPPIARPSPADQTPPPPPEPVSVSTGLDTPPQERAQGKDLPSLAYVRAQWTPVTDPSGISAYQVVWIPVPDSGTPSPEERREIVVRYSDSPIRTDYTFHGIPPGQRGIVRVRAMDGTGNLSPWAESPVIVAGGEPTSLSPPALTVIPQPLGIQVFLSEVPEAHGYELYLDTSDPGTEVRHLFYRGPLRRHFIPWPYPETLYLRARAYAKNGVYSPTVGASGSPRPLSLDEVADGSIFKRQPLQRIEDLYAEVSAARGSLPSLGERISSVVQPDGTPSPALALRSVSFMFASSVKHDFGAGTKDVVVFFETAGRVRLHRFHLVQYDSPTSPYTIEIWAKPVSGDPELVDQETVSESGLYEFLHDKSQIIITHPAQIFVCVSTTHNAQGILSYSTV